MAAPCPCQGMTNSPAPASIDATMLSVTARYTSNLWCERTWVFMISSCAERESRRIAALPDAREVWCSVWCRALTGARGHNVSGTEMASWCYARSGTWGHQGLVSVPVPPPAWNILLSGCCSAMLASSSITLDHERLRFGAPHAPKVRTAP